MNKILQVKQRSTSFTAEAEPGDILDIYLLDESDNSPSNLRAQVIRNGQVVQTYQSTDFVYETNSEETFEVQVVGRPDFSDLAFIELRGSAKGIDIDEVVRGFPNTETVSIKSSIRGSIGAGGTLTPESLDGVAFIQNKGGNIDVPVSNLSPSFERYESNFRANGGLSGSWANLASDALPNLRYLRGKAGSSVVYGTFTDLQNAAPNLVELVASYENIVEGESLDKLHGFYDLEVFSFKVNSSISSTFSDLDGTDSSGRHVLESLREFTLTHNSIVGDVGNMAAHIEYFSSVRSDQNAATTWDNYMPSNFDQLKHLEFVDSVATHDALDSWLGSASNEASYLNGHGHSLIFYGDGNEAKSSWGWNARQHPYRALTAKPDVSVSLSSEDDEDTGGSYDPKAGWLDHWAVANVVGMPDASTITVKKPSGDGASDTNARDEGTDSDISIPTDGSLSGSDLHIFETTSGNRSDPLTESGGFTVYLVDSVVDDGASDELTINLDTTNGPSLTDTGSGGYSAETRMSVTW